MLQMKMWAFSIVLSLFLSFNADANPGLLSYQGRIVRSDGAPLQYGSVSFLFQVMAHTGDCVVYEEQLDNIDMSGSGGLFDVAIGKGAVKYPGDSSVTLMDALNNNKSFICKNGDSYQPIGTSGRRLRVQFWDGKDWKSITPEMEIRSVPFAGYALSAQKIGDNSADDFLLRAGIPQCGAGTVLKWGGSAFTCENFVPSGGGGGGSGAVTNVSSANAYITVANGGTTPVITAVVGTTADTLAAGNDARFTNARTPTGAASGDLDGTYPGPSVVKVRGNSVAAGTLTGPDTGKVYRWDGSALTPAFLNFGDLKTAAGSQQLVTACAANKKIQWSVITDSFTCEDIGALDAGVITTGQIANARLPQSATAWTVSGADVYRSGGKVGIGIAGPTAELDVVGTVKATAFQGNGAGLTGVSAAPAGANNEIQFNSSGVMGASSNFRFHSTMNTLGLGPTPTGTIGSGYMIINDPGDARAGMSLFNSNTTSADSRGFDMALVFNRLEFNLYENDDMIFKTANSERFRIKSNGRVGVGVTAPGYKLDVNGDINMATNMPLRSGGRQMLLMETGGNTTLDSNGAASQIRLQPNGAAAMTLTASGNVGIGTLAPTDKLTVVSSELNSYMGFSNSGMTASVEGATWKYMITPGPGLTASSEPVSNAGLAFKIQGATDSSEPLQGIYTFDGKVGVGVSMPSQALDVNGTIRATDLIQTSDRRAKRDIASLESASALEKVCRLRPVTFKWKKTGQPDQGVIAQELREVFPEMVVENNDGSLSVKYTSLIAPLVSSVQELNKKNEELASENQQLKERLERLEKIVEELVRK